MREGVLDFIQFLKSVVVRWFNVFAGAFVTAVWTIYERITGKPLPIMAFWSLIGFCALLATFLAWREQLQKAKVRETEREKAVRECFERAAVLLKKPTEYQYGREFQEFFKAE